MLSQSRDSSLPSTETKEISWAKATTTICAQYISFSYYWGYRSLRNEVFRDYTCVMKPYLNDDTFRTVKVESE